jgi:hypothetical protein
VWSFGVVVWEIFSLGSRPFAALSNVEVFDAVKAGKRLEKPSLCPDSYYDFMTKCWENDAELRPSFEDICKILPGLK